MTNHRLWLWIAAYVLGLGIAELWETFHWPRAVGPGLILLGSVAIAAQFGTQLWRRGPSRRDWIIASLVTLAAAGWWAMRYPTPAQGDISHFITPNSSQVVVGWIDSMPSKTRDDRQRFWLRPETVQTYTSPERIQSTRGRLYVTLSEAASEAAAALWPGQKVEIEGYLYQPRPSVNPGGFDFQAFLARQGSFAGLSGQSVHVLTALPVGLRPRLQYHLAQGRSRMVNAAIAGLDDRAGKLVSSMVLGRRAVNLPYDVQDQFLRAGLAHTLAASGFHVSLLLAVVLTLTHGCSARMRLAIGVGALLTYVTLTGIQPSVMRAALMGVGALVGTTLDRRTRPIGALVTAGFLLLVVNPLWMGNVGFWLSWLATLGLLVSVPALMSWFDWLPTIAASLLAVPIAASLWVLPLQLYAFGVLSPYSVLLSAITTPFVVVITLGGMLSAVASVVSPFAGSAIAWTLTYPVQGLVWLVAQANQLPGSALVIGNIWLVTMLGIYGLWLLGWLHPWWRDRRWVVGLMAVLLIVAPAGYRHIQTVEMTVLDAQHHPAVVLRDRGRVVVLTDGHLDAVRYSLLPYLRQQGIYRINQVITPWLSSAEPQLQGWHLLTQETQIATIFSGAGIQHNSDLLPRAQVQPLPIQAPLTLGDMTLTVQRTAPLTIQLQHANFSGVLLPTLWSGNARRLQQEQQTLLASGLLAQPTDIFYWSGAPLLPAVVANLTARIAIAAADQVDDGTVQAFRDRQIELYITGQHGALRATQQRGVEIMTASGLDSVPF